MKITELLNSKVQYEIIEDQDYVFATRAKIGDRLITFYAGCEEDDGVWEIEFKESTIAGKGSTFDLTGSGNELEVFSMIKDSIKELIAKHNPEKIVFIADKSKGSTKRADMYARLLKRFNPSGYVFDRHDESDYQYGARDKFIMTKK